MHISEKCGIIKGSGNKMLYSMLNGRYIYAAA